MQLHFTRISAPCLIQKKIIFNFLHFFSSAVATSARRLLLQLYHCVSVASMRAAHAVMACPSDILLLH